MDIQIAIYKIRQHLDEIEKLSEALPSTYTIEKLPRDFQDWMDIQGFPRGAQFRRSMWQISKRVDKGFTAEEIKSLKTYRRRLKMHPVIDSFCDKWSAQNKKADQC